MKKHIEIENAVIRCKLDKVEDYIELLPRWTDEKPHDASEPFILTFDEADKLHHALAKLRKRGTSRGKSDK
ncbi:MAG: hypothetical protein QOG19_2635 [Mycobacterium sp.]|jgi:hypothetical protein|nr:hypothetical protein [Mycobacterium sp.]MDT5225228.1 hypothetical protein [Mycobacterium sp.]